MAQKKRSIDAFCAPTGVLTTARTIRVNTEQGKPHQVLKVGAESNGSPVRGRAGLVRWRMGS